MSLFPNVYGQLVADPEIAAIVGDKVFRAVAEAVPAPYIVWTVLAAPPENNLSNTPPGDMVSVRIDCYARNEAEVDTLAQKARNSLQVRGTVETLQDLGMEPETGYWRITFDVDLYHHRS